jgi:hypothetical protein
MSGTLGGARVQEKKDSKITSARYADHVPPTHRPSCRSGQRLLPRFAFPTRPPPSQLIPVYGRASHCVQGMA